MPVNPSSGSAGAGPRGSLENEVITRCGGWMRAAGLDATHADGTNADLNGPVRRAVAACGVVPLDPTNVSDAEVQACYGKYDKLADIAVAVALESCLRNMSKVTVSAAGLTESFSDLRRDCAAEVDRTRKQLKLDYGFGLGTLKGGSLDLGFAAGAGGEF